MPDRKIHYAWLIVFSGLLTLFSCMGLARFALGMLLPSMGVDLNLSYSEMGIISTSNFTGYLVSVFLCGRMIRDFGERKTIVFGLTLITISMLLISQSDEYLLILLLYFLTGIGSGAANITAMTLVAHWFSQKYRGRAAGYMIFGNGLGITASGLLIPWFNENWPELGWRLGWEVFAIISALITLIVALIIRNKPSDIGLGILGDAKAGSQKFSSSSFRSKPEGKSSLIAHIGMIYFIFGFTYVIYTTFIVTSLVEQHGYSEDEAGHLWMLIGIVSIFSGALFGWVSDHYSRKAGIISVYTIQTASYLLAATDAGETGLLVSMLLFGLTAFSIPAIIAATISDHFQACDAGRIFGYVTLFFAVGQTAGPALSGYLAELSGSFATGYALAAFMTFTGILLTWLLRESRTTIKMR